ncbi:MAG: superoxide dismutase [Micromonosporaceae bacterium]|nr:superoxide dismutase [Micromonosporaceae bacterium]
MIPTATSAGAGVGDAGAAADAGAAGQRPTAGPAVFPTTIPLPDGFQPEGVAIGAFPFAFFGSLADGAIYRANLITGHGKIVSPGPGTPSVGLDLDRRGRLFVAGGTAGDARVVSTLTGKVLASYPLGGGFINDVVVTPDAAWLTDSLNPVLYRLPLGRHGSLPAEDEAVAVPLSGDFVPTPGFNANGISRAPDGTGLLVVQTSTGLLFRVDPATGAATEVDLGGETLPDADGMLLHGRTLYVVQNRLNRVAVVRLDHAGTSGTVTERLTDPRFDVPTTVARFGGRLYLPNARFTTPPTPTTEYAAVAIPRT